MRIGSIVLAIFLINCRVDAANISFDVDGFTGSWGVDNGPTYWGNQTFDLSVGDHFIFVALGGTASFTVNVDGSVTSNNLTVMSHSGSTLTLNNLEIYFDVAQFTQPYMICTSGFHNGSKTLRLPPGIDLAIVLQPVWSVVASPFQTVGVINIAANGAVTVLSGAERFSGGSYEVSFQVIPIFIDPQNFPGTYTFPGTGNKEGPSIQYLLPNSHYAIINVRGHEIGAMITGASGLVSSAVSPVKTELDTVYFYQNRYTVTPPSGYTGGWGFLWGYGAKYGVDDIWLLRGATGQVYVDGSDYLFAATSDCTQFIIPTHVGNFELTCSAGASYNFYFTPLTEDGFNPIAGGYTVHRYDGRFSLDPDDYILTVNGSNVVLTSVDLTNDTFHEANAFEQGRNEVVLDGKDEDGNLFQSSKVFWAGGAEVTIRTHGATDAVTLMVEQLVGGVRYTKAIVQVAVDHETVFNNVPQVADGVVYISTERGQKALKGKLPKQLAVQL